MRFFLLIRRTPFFSREAAAEELSSLLEISALAGFPRRPLLPLRSERPDAALFQLSFFFPLCGAIPYSPPFPPCHGSRRRALRDVGLFLVRTALPRCSMRILLFFPPIRLQHRIFSLVRIARCLRSSRIAHGGMSFISSICRWAPIKSPTPHLPRRWWSEKHLPAASSMMPPFPSFFFLAISDKSTPRWTPSKQ